jgi:hypothetical protein
MPEVRPFFQKAMLLSEVGWNTPPFLTQGPEEPNDFLSPGSEMKWTPLHLGKQIYVCLSVYLSFFLSVRLSLWNTPPFLTQGPKEPNDFLSPGSEMKWTPLHLGKPKLCLFHLSFCLFVCLSVCLPFSVTLPPSSLRVPKNPTTFFRPDQK